MDLGSIDMGATRKKDITGERFGALVVLGDDGKDRWGQYMWRCACDCGKEHRAAGGKLRIGEVKSCGCKKGEMCAAANTKHGLTPRGGKIPREYEIWSSMIGRCENPNNDAYQYYGGRGIRVCPRWRADFLAFFEDMGRRPSDGHSIERKDTNGNYEPANCIWATKTQQARNKRNNVNLTYQGETMCLSEWARRKGIRKLTLWNRIQKGGWSVEQALETPVRQMRGSS